MGRKTWVLLTVCLATLSINLDTTIVNVALPELARELDAGTRDLLWVVDGYNLAFAGLVLAMGSLTDRFGRRPGLMVGLTGFAVATGVAALVDDVHALIALRFVMGAFAAIIFPTTLSVIANTFTDRRERAAALGAWGAATGLGVAAGPVSGGALLEHFTWHSVFWALVPVALLALAMTAAFVPESRDPRPVPLDGPGLVLSVAALGLLTFTIIEAPDHGWLSAATLSGFAVTLLLGAAFVRRELRTAHPMLDVTLFRDPRFSAASASVTVCFFTLFGFIFLITQYFQFVRDVDPLGTGLRILPVAISLAAAAVAGGLLAPRLGTKAVVTTGLLMLSASYLWISRNAVDASYAAQIVPQMILMGGGLGLVSTPATESILRVLPPSRAGVGSAVNDATRELGGTLGVAVVGSLFSSLYAGRLTDGLQGTGVPASAIAAAKDSVGYADALARQVPQVADAVNDAFMRGLSAGCLLIGLLALAAAVGAFFALPGDRYDPLADLPGSTVDGDDRLTPAAGRRAADHADDAADARAGREIAAADPR